MGMSSLLKAGSTRYPMNSDKNADNLPHNSTAPKRGRLKNGNPSGDVMKAPRCGARNRAGNSCQAPAMRGKQRCRLHGGKATGARTIEGIHRIRAANWKDGSRSARLLAEAKVLAEKERLEITAEMTDGWRPSTILFRRLLGLPDFPNIRVRMRLRCPAPPAEWLKR